MLKQFSDVDLKLLPNKFILACYLGKAGSLVGKLH